MRKLGAMWKATSEPVQSYPTMATWEFKPPYQALCSPSLGTVGSRHPQGNGGDLAACSDRVGKKGSGNGTFIKRQLFVLV